MLPALFLGCRELGTVNAEGGVGFCLNFYTEVGNRDTDFTGADVLFCFLFPDRMQDMSA